MGDEPRLSVIIPLYNGADTIAACLEALRGSTFPSYEVIVVDDGSRDGGPEEAERMGCRVLRQPNRGPAAARNAGAAVARAELLFFLDADVLVTADTLSDVVAAFDARPGLSALFCSYQRDTVPQNFCSQYKNLVHHFTHQTARDEAATFCGGFGGIRTGVFHDIGGFDEQYRMMEDVELGYRLHRAGRAIRLEKGIQLTHCKRYSFRGLVKSDVFGRAIPWTRIMLEKRIARNDLNTRLHNVLSVPVAFALPVAAAAAPFFPPAAWVLAALLAVFLALNLRFLAFVGRVKGPWFALRTVGMLWVTYLYSGIGLIAGVCGHLAAALRRKAPTAELCRRP